MKSPIRRKEPPSITASMLSTADGAPAARPRPQPVSKTDNNPYSTDSELRASVFDVFSQLGGLEHDSRIAHWIFNDPSVPDVQRPCIRFNTRSGSRFREGLDRDSADGSPRTSRHRGRSQSPPPPAKKEGFFKRVRSRSRGRGEAKRDREPKERDKEKKEDIPLIPTAPSATKKTFLGFGGSSQAISPSRPVGVAWHKRRKSATILPLSKDTGNLTPLSPNFTINEDEWDRVSVLTAPAAPGPDDNPFLQGPSTPKQENAEAGPGTNDDSDGEGTPKIEVMKIGKEQASEYPFPDVPSHTSASAALSSSTSTTNTDATTATGSTTAPPTPSSNTSTKSMKDNPHRFSFRTFVLPNSLKRKTSKSRRASLPVPPPLPISQAETAVPPIPLNAEPDSSKEDAETMTKEVEDDDDSTPTPASEATEKAPESLAAAENVESSLEPQAAEDNDAATASSHDQATVPSEGNDADHSSPSSSDTPSSPPAAPPIDDIPTKDTN